MKKEQGFTLVELSIVLVIIGLIVGGVIVGADLIKVSKLQAIVKEYEKHKSSIGAFEAKFNALPGDMRNAHIYWGAECHTDSSFCNGNGDRRMAYNNETAMMWTHLSLAGMTNGDYRGCEWSTGSGCTEPLGDNLPRSRFNDGGWYVANNDISEAMIMLVRYPPGEYTGVLHEAIATPEEAYFIDLKVDDGIPLTGMFYGFNPYVAPNQCITSLSVPSEYRLDMESIECNLQFDSVYQ